MTGISRTTACMPEINGILYDVRRGMSSKGRNEAMDTDDELHKAWVGTCMGAGASK